MSLTINCNNYSLNVEVGLSTVIVTVLNVGVWLSSVIITVLNVDVWLWAVLITINCGNVAFNLIITVE